MAKKDGNRSERDGKQVKLLVGIISPKDEAAFAEAVNEHAVAINFMGMAFGTAKSNYLSYLGLDEIEKRVVMSMIPDHCEKQLLKSVNKALRMYLPGKGIAFTMPMSAVSSILSNAILSTPVREEQSTGREEQNMSEENDTKREETTDKPAQASGLHDLIVAVVNQKYTDKVLESTRLAGATGATLLHTRSIANERAEQIIGTTLRQETDTIFLLTSAEYKLKIMEAIRDTAGLKTDGGAVLFSLPVDSITGIGRFAEEE